MESDCALRRSWQIDWLTWPEVRDAIARDAGVIMPVALPSSMVCICRLGQTSSCPSNSRGR